MTTLKLGSKGNDVKLLLQKLNLLDDGIFGSLTEEAVKVFQKEYGLLPDGIVGPGTWAKLTNNNSRKINSIILHCSATPEGKDYTIEDIKLWHLLRGFNDIGYHYVIYRDGSLHIGRYEHIVGAHCTNHNANSIGICTIGGLASDCKTPKDTRTLEQKITLVRLVKLLLLKYNLTINNVHCHNEYANKACPSYNIEQFKKEFKQL